MLLELTIFELSVPTRTVGLIIDGTERDIGGVATALLTMTSVVLFAVNLGVALETAVDDLLVTVNVVCESTEDCPSISLVLNSGNRM